MIHKIVDWFFNKILHINSLSQLKEAIRLHKIAEDELFKLTYHKAFGITQEDLESRLNRVEKIHEEIMKILDKGESEY